MEQRDFGTLPDGRMAHHYRLAHPSGLAAEFTDYGGILLALHVPLPDGRTVDVIAGQADWESCLGPHPSMGILVGRYGNRIGQGRFSLDGKDYQLAQNKPPHHLHGGNKGFGKQLWEGRQQGESLHLSYLSVDGEEQYPGNLRVEVTYSLTDDLALRIAYRAVTDAPTVLNLTHHGYFNLAGVGSILDHELRLAADHICDADEALIPTGKLLPVAGTPFDFTESKPIGQDIEADHVLLKHGKGYDHNFVVRGWDGSLREIAEVREPQSGLEMQVWTTEPGVQLYTANHLSNFAGKYGQVYQPRTAFCLETQHFPDSPNHPNFPTTVLRPGEVYEQITEYRFSS